MVLSTAKRIIWVSGGLLIINGIYIIAAKKFLVDYSNFTLRLHMQGLGAVSIFLGIFLVYIGLDKR